MKRIGTALLCLVLLLSILPPSLSVSAETDCEINGHDFIDATCTSAKKCAICSLEEGEPLGHKWQEATCYKPKTCQRCKITEGERNPHEMLPADCNYPKRCKNCSKTVGERLKHKSQNTACGERPKCIYCGKNMGEAKEHYYEEYWDDTCKNCGYIRKVDYDYVISVGETLVIEEDGELPVQFLVSDSKVLGIKSNVNYHGEKDSSSQSGLRYYHRVTLIAQKVGTVRLYTRYRSMSGRGEASWYIKVVEGNGSSKPVSAITTKKSTTQKSTKATTTTKPTEKMTESTTKSTTKSATEPITESTTTPIAEKTESTTATAASVVVGDAVPKDEDPSVLPYLVGGIGGVLVIAAAVLVVLNKKKK